MKGSIGNSRFSLSRKDRHSIDVFFNTNSGSLLPIPDLTDFIGIYSQHAVNPSYFPSGGDMIAVQGDSDNALITNTIIAPYPLDWASSGWTTAGTNPRLTEWIDQVNGLGTANTEVGSVSNPSIDVGNESFDWISANTDGLTTANALPNGVTALTIFVAIDVTTLDVNRVAIIKGNPIDQFGNSGRGNSGRGQFTIHALSTGNGQIVVAQNSSSKATEINSKIYSLPPSTNGKLLLTAILDRTASVSDQTKMWLNGVNVGVDSGTVDMASGSFEPIQIGIGWGDSGGGVSYFDGSISNVWIATGAFNDARREEVEAFIAQITGITL